MSVKGKEFHEIRIKESRIGLTQKQTENAKKLVELVGQRVNVLYETENGYIEYYGKLSFNKEDSHYFQVKTDDGFFFSKFNAKFISSVFETVNTIVIKEKT